MTITNFMKATTYLARIASPIKSINTWPVVIVAINCITVTLT